MLREARSARRGGQCSWKEIGLREMGGEPPICLFYIVFPLCNGASFWNRLSLSVLSYECLCLSICLYGSLCVFVGPSGDLFIPIMLVFLLPWLSNNVISGVVSYSMVKILHHPLARSWRKGRVTCILATWARSEAHRGNPHNGGFNVCPLTSLTVPGN